jgi:hypothetical protein
MGRAVEGSPQARKLACAILEVLAGLAGPTEAAEALSTSLNRYYVLEARALEGLVKALEPRNRGRAPTVEQQVETLKRELRRLKTELDSSRSLLRMAQRTVGLPSPKKKAKPKRRGSRSKKVLRLLRPKEEKEKVS